MAPNLQMMLPLAIMYGYNQLKIEEKGLVHWLQAAYVTAQVLSLLAVVVIWKVMIKENKKKLDLPEVKQMGQVMAESFLQKNW